MRTSGILLAAALVLAGASVSMAAGDAAEAILSDLRSKAIFDTGQEGFSAERGDAFYHASHDGGVAESCATCHGADPTRAGALPNGQPVAPLAPSANAQRMADKGAYLRQLAGCCNMTTGADCTPLEKGDITRYLKSR